MKFHTEYDLNTGKRFFNPQQDMRDQSINEQTKSIRNHQDLMAFLYLSCLISKKEKSEISATLRGLGKLHNLLEAQLGYRPDIDRPKVTPHDWDYLARARRLTRIHPWLTRLYRIRSIGQILPNRVSKRVEWSLIGGPYFQRWQKQRERTKSK